MTAVAKAASAAVVLVKLPAPPVNTTSPLLRVVWMRIGPAAPAAPSWMWAAVMFDPVGNAVNDTLYVTVAAVMALAPSRVTMKVIVAVPRATDSAFPTGGTSFEGSIVAVKTTTFG